MRKKLLIVFTILLCVSVALSLAACKDKKDDGNKDDGKGSGVTAAEVNAKIGALSTTTEKATIQSNIVSVIGGNKFALPQDGEATYSAKAISVANIPSYCVDIETSVTADTYFATLKTNMASEGWVDIDDYDDGADAAGEDGDDNILIKIDGTVCYALNVSDASEFTGITLILCTIDLSAYGPGGSEDNPDSDPSTYTRVTSLEANKVGTFYGETQNLVIADNGTGTLGNTSFNVYTDEAGSKYAKIGNDYVEIRTFGNYTIKLGNNSYYREVDGLRRYFNTSDFAGTYEYETSSITISADGKFSISIGSYEIWKNATTNTFYIYKSYVGFEEFIVNGNEITYDEDTYTKAEPWIDVTTGLGTKVGYFEDATLSISISATGEVSHNGISLGQLVTRDGGYAVKIVNNAMPTAISFPTDDTVYYQGNTYTRATPWDILTAAGDKAGYYEYFDSEGNVYLSLTVNSNGTIILGTNSYQLYTRNTTEFAYDYSTAKREISFGTDTCTFDSNTYTKTSTTWTAVTSVNADLVGYYETTSGTTFSVTVSATGVVKEDGGATFALYQRNNVYSFKDGNRYIVATFGTDSLEYSNKTYEKTVPWEEVTEAGDLAGYYEYYASSYSEYTGITIDEHGVVKYFGYTYQLYRKGTEYALDFDGTKESITLAGDTLTYGSNTYTKATPWEAVTDASELAGDYEYKSDYYNKTFTIDADGTVKEDGYSEYKLFKRGTDYSFRDSSFYYYTVTFGTNDLTYNGDVYTKAE